LHLSAVSWLYPHYAVPGEGDLPFAIGLLLYEMEDYEDALEFFEASLEQHGPTLPPSTTSHSARRN
jgi:tetratricopeptide (TPR) repeat protein